MQNASSHSQPFTPPGFNTELSNLRILLAEDNLLNQKLTIRQLAGLGYCADVVADGQTAVNAVIGAAGNAYDLVLMDCQMPGLDGFAATQAIRDWERSTGLQSDPIVIIAMTASDLRQDQQRAIEVGMDDYLVKPVRQAVLRLLLERWSRVALDHAAARSFAGSGSSKALLSPATSADRAMHYLSSHLHSLYRLADGSLEFAAELLQIFIQDSDRQFNLLQQAIEQQNFQQIEQIAHYLKGASANVGATTMQQLAEEVELRSRQHHGAGLSDLVVRLEASLRQIEIELAPLQQFSNE
jgi:CheY-like chemotaxis protein